MAVVRNHQLKVWNRFNSGEQNIPADHLIEDTAFSYARNVNISDTTIRPIRGNQQVQDVVIATGTKAVIKENVKGVDTLLSFNTPIQFINYADTVYYIEDTDTGSKFKQISTDGSLARMNVIPSLTGEVFVDTQVSLTDEVNSLQNAIKQGYNNYKAGMRSKGQAHGYGTYVLDALIYTITTHQPNIFKPIFDLPMQDNLSITQIKSEVKQFADRKKDIADAIAIHMTELSQDYRTALLGFTSLYSVKKLMYNEYANPTLYSCGVSEINLAIYNNRYEISKVLRKAHDEASILQYIFTHQVNPYVTGVNPCNNEWDGITEGNIPNDNQKGLYISAKDAIRYLAEDLENLDSSATTDTDKTNAMEAMFWHKPYKAYSLVNMIHALFMEDSSYLLSSNNMSLHETIWKDYRDSLKAYQDIVDNTKFIDDIFNKIVSYAIVGKDIRNNAYTNVLRKEDIFEKEGSTITVQLANPELDTYYLYRRTPLSTDYLKAFQLSNAGYLSFSVDDIPKNGSVLPYPYQVKDQPTDFTIIAEHNGTIFLARKDSQELWYTNTGNPHYIKSTNYIKMPQTIKAMQSAGAGVFVWTTNNTMYLLTGESYNSDGKNTLSIKLIGQNVSLIDKHAVTSVDNLVIWLSDYSFHNTSGYGSADTTTQFWKPPTLDRVISSVVHRSKAYYLVDTPEGRQLITYDYRLKRVFTDDADHYQNLQIIDGKLTILMEDSSLYGFQDSVHLKPYSVHLKRYAGYSFDTRQRFTNVTLYHTAKPYKDTAFDINARTKVRVYVDGWLAGEEEVQGTQATRIDLPQNNNTGYSIQIRLEGVLCIKSLRVRYATIDWED